MNRVSRSTPFLNQGRKTLLPQSLVNGDSDGVGKVKRTESLAHGDSHATIGIPLENPRVNPAALATEQQESVCAVRYVGIGSRCAPREQMQFRTRLALDTVHLEEILHTCPADNLDLIPIVTACACKIALRKPKTHRLNKVQARANACTSPSNIARVLRYFRFYENNV